MKNEEINNILIDITNKTYEFFNTNNEKLITPVIYNNLFLKKVDTLEEKKKEKILKYLSTTTSNIDENLKTFSSQIKEFNKNTEKAITAIKNKDEKVLNNIQKDMEKIQKELLKVKEELYTDNLTTAKNRKWLKEEILKDSKFQTKGLLSFIDLDNFKQINDNMGHIIGDKVLIFTVSYLKKSLINYKIKFFEIIRYAGDEFLILFLDNNLNIDKISRILKLIQNNFKKQKLTIKDNHDKIFNISFSIGNCSFLKNDKFETIIEIADKEMYNDKNKLI